MSEELREKAKAATPGGWTYGMKYVAKPTGTGLFKYIAMAPSGDVEPEGGEWEKNASFIAAANPSVILALLDERDSLITANEGMRKALTRLVESELAAKVRSLVAGWNGEGVPEEYRFGRHPDSLGVTLPTDCGSMYMLDEVLADLRAALSPALNSKLAPAGEGEANG